ncbi:hypothetical protein [Clostridium sp. CCUG 7971]|uniref:hypothetical protein n=1 Tax=Clostridium sp. CCUG 7971 TaxID=2811414 RepID=UPI001ABBDE1F|nr:hypothetical protein [Clostridium sp. CCUG 7971]MBO3445260.1 hypothetical protein [Clostridium sp. CCUG 7971]
MTENLIDVLFYSFTFYIIYSILHRLIEINRYIKKSNLDGTYSETYKLMYSKHLKGNCILTSVIIGFINLTEQYINIVFAIVIGISIGLCISPIFEKYYPKPEENL